MIKGLCQEFMDFDDTLAWHDHPGCCVLSEADRELIKDQQRNVIERVSKRVDTTCPEYSIDDLADVALVWPDASRWQYSGELEHATSRFTVGAFSGEKVVRQTREWVANDRGILEYGCCLLVLEEQLTIEFVRMTAFPDEVLVTVNASKLLEMPLDRRPMPWPFAPYVEEPSEVRVNDEPYGVISNESTWRQWRIAILRDDGFRMPIPLQFGSSASDVLMFVWRLLTLMPLWSRSMPVNRSRVIDPAIASQLVTVKQTALAENSI